MKTTSRSDCSSHSAFCYCIDEPYHNYQECNADAPNPLPLHRCPSSHRPGRVQHGGLTTTSAQIVTNQTCRRETEGPTLANAPFMSADHIHGTVFLQRSATLTVTQRHICFIVLLLINFYFIFYTYVHYLLTIVMHSRPSLYDWALEHFLSYIIKPYTVTQNTAFTPMILTNSQYHWFTPFFGRPLGPGLCHRKSVRPSVTLVYCGQTA